METKENVLDELMVDWKDQILQMERWELGTPLFGVYPLKEGQRKMLLRALPRWINRKGIKTITRVVKEGEYKESDKELLNEVREWFLGSH